MFKYAHTALLASVLLLPCTSALSAIQGGTSATQSSAVTTITLAIEPNIQISNVSDIVIDVTDRNRDVEFEESICVRGNTGGRYTVTAADVDGGNTPFQLRSENGDRIGYQVFFRGDLDRANKDELLPGQSSPFYDIESGSVDCNGNNTAAFTIYFKSQDILPAAPGIYTGFLSVTAAAE